MDKQERFLTHKRVVFDSEFYYHNLTDKGLQLKKIDLLVQNRPWYSAHMKLSASKIFSVSGFVQHVKE